MIGVAKPHGTMATFLIFFFFQFSTNIVIDLSDGGAGGQARGGAGRKRARK